MHRKTYVKNFVKKVLEPLAELKAIKRFKEPLSLHADDSEYLSKEEALKALVQAVKTTEYFEDQEELVKRACAKAKKSGRIRWALTEMLEHSLQEVRDFATVTFERAGLNVTLHGFRIIEPTEKTCTMCGKVKPLSEFHLSGRKGTKRRRACECRTCASKRAARWRARNHDKLILSMREARVRAKERLGQLLWLLLETHVCADCGEDDPTVLDFDRPHKRGSSIGRVIGIAYKEETALKKVSGWPIRCKNCIEKRRIKETWKAPFVERLSHA